MFYKSKAKREKEEKKRLAKQARKERGDNTTLTIIVFSVLLLISLITAIIGSAAGFMDVITQGVNKGVQELQGFMDKFNQDVEVELTDPVEVVDEAAFKNKLSAAGLTDLASKENITGADIVNNTQALISDLTLTQAEVGLLFNYILQDEYLQVKISQLELSATEDDSRIDTIIEISIEEYINSIEGIDEFKPYLPKGFVIEYGITVAINEEGTYYAKDSDIKIKNFADDVNETIIMFLESILNEGESVESMVNDALVRHMTDTENGLLAWMGASGVVIEQGQVTFNKKVA